MSDLNKVKTWILLSLFLNIRSDVAFHQNLSQILWPTEKSTWYMDFPIETTIHDKSIRSGQFFFDKRAWVNKTNNF